MIYPNRMTILAVFLTKWNSLNFIHTKTNQPLCQSRMKIMELLKVLNSITFFHDSSRNKYPNKYDVEIYILTYYPV